MTITKADMKFFRLAKAVAETSEFHNFHLGCVIVYKKHVLSVGVNSDKTHPKQMKYNGRRNFTKTNKPIHHKIHAEIDALTKISYPVDQNIDWKQVKVYIYRVSPGKKSGHGLAKPCPACLAALRAKGVRHIYYTTDESYAYERFDD